jgi:ubiquitin carboxyl-terminal hydrolase 14
MQQDAEECWTNLLYVLREKLKATTGAGAGASGSDGESAVERMLGIGTRLKLKCEESQEELEPVRFAGCLFV